MEQIMICSKTETRLNALIDNEVSPAERASLLSHLEHCNSCKEEYETLVSLNSMLSEFPESSCPPELLEKLKAIPRTSTRKVTRLNFVQRLRTLSVAASILLTIFSVLFLSNKLMNDKSQENGSEYIFSQESLYSHWESVNYGR